MIGQWFPPMPALSYASPHAVQAVLFIFLLALAAAFDIRNRIIPNSICALIALSGLIVFSPAKLFGMLIALPLLVAALCKQDSIGGGDIKLTAATGLVLGFWAGVAGLIIGLAAMLLFHAARQTAGWLRKGKNRNRDKRAALPMAPFLSIGFLAAYILG